MCSGKTVPCPGLYNFVYESRLGLFRSCFVSLSIVLIVRRFRFTKRRWWGICIWLSTMVYYFIAELSHANADCAKKRTARPGNMWQYVTKVFLEFKLHDERSISNSVNYYTALRGTCCRTSDVALVDCVENSKLFTTCYSYRHHIDLGPATRHQRIFDV